jgi:hypothetical protein
MLFVSRSKHTLELLFLIAIILIGALGFGAYAFSKSPSSTVAALPAGPIVIRGTLLCLPHRDTSGPHTASCAYGLMDSAGRYYALRDTSPSYKNISSVPTNAQVEVIGTFAPKEDTTYQSSGIISVTSISIVALTPPTVSLQSGVKGNAILGPTCPIERTPLDTSCADRAYVGKLQLMDQTASTVIASFTTAKDGTYRVEAAPGIYVIRSPRIVTVFPSCSSGTIVIKAHAYTTMRVTCDSGIR